MTQHDRSSWTATDRDRRGQTAVTIWSVVWVTVFLVVDFVAGRDGIAGNAAVVGLTAVVVLVGIGWILAYVRFIRHVDELMRKIQLDAMAVALGSGFVAGFAVMALESGDLIEARPSYVMLAMVAAYVGTVVRGLFRYGYNEQ